MRSSKIDLENYKGSTYSIHPHIKAFLWLHFLLISFMVYNTLFIEEYERYKYFLILH
jgi:hypothetical protein